MTIFSEKWFEKLKHDADERSIKVKRMREAGMTYGDIAKVLGVSRQRAKQIDGRTLSKKGD